MKLGFLAGLVLIAATPVTTSWLVGDLTDEESLRLAAEGVPLDYGIDPITFGPTGDRIIGVVACAAAVIAWGILVQSTVTSRLHRGWWLVLVPLVAAGIITGFAWRVWTAGGIGANIGAGLVIIVGGPLVLGLLIAAAVPAVMLLRDGRDPARTGR